MDSHSPARMVVVKKEDKEAKLRELIRAALVASAHAVAPIQLRVLALSLTSPVAVAIAKAGVTTQARDAHVALAIPVDGAAPAGRARGADAAAVDVGLLSVLHPVAARDGILIGADRDRLSVATHQDDYCQKEITHGHDLPGSAEPNKEPNEESNSRQMQPLAAAQFARCASRAAWAKRPEGKRSR